MLFNTNASHDAHKEITTVEEAREAAAALRWFVAQNLGENHPAHVHLKKAMEALNAAMQDRGAP